MTEIVSLLILVLLACLLAWLSDRRYRALPALPPAGSPARLPSLSIIVPARDEAANLRRLLPSLAALTYPGRLEVIVVDDDSQDETAQVARLLGARVLSVERLPAGWLGKTHACHLGAQAARGAWLLFTDADTEHAPSGPAASVAYAAAQDFEGLSLFLEQMTSGLPENLALSTAFAGLFAALPAEAPLLNGQYLLVRQEVYHASGGFEAVRGEPLEDLALGRRLASLGYRVPMLRGASAARVWMYSSGEQMWRGIERLGAGSLQWVGNRGLFPVVLVAGAATPPVVLLMQALDGGSTAWGWIAWLAVTLSFLPWSRRFGPAWSAGLVPLGAWLVAVSASWGLVARALGRAVPWKGRGVRRLPPQP